MEERYRKVLGIIQMSEALEKSHMEDSKSKGIKWNRAQQDRNTRTGVTSVKFVIGDYVLIRTTLEFQHKLTSKGVVPMRRVGAQSYLVFAVENPVSTRKEIAHAKRLPHYPALIEVE